LLNKVYENNAGFIIDKMKDEGIKGLEFLIGNDTKVPWGILRALGRWDEESIRYFAPIICEAQKNHDTKRTVRQWGEWIIQQHYRISETVSENK
jgi:hypothetical protein